ALFTFIVLIPLILIISGCKQGKEEVASNGIDVSFIEPAPPSEVSRGQNFPIYVNLENKGGYDLNPGEARLYLEGLFPTSFSLSLQNLKKTNSELLLKAGEETLGGKERVVFTENARYVGSVVPFNQTFIARSCYLYESSLTTNLCFALDSSATCSLDGEKTKDSIVSVSPVQITSLTEERSGKNLMIKFKVENLGTGKVYLPDTNCDSPEPWKENKVVATFGTGEPVICKTFKSAKSGEVDVDSIVACERDMENTQAHTSPANINIRFAYIELEQKNVRFTE
ncbi:MAG: hypothetical protein AABX59_02720, partial [Nanoarchaeota archaeon]